MKTVSVTVHMYRPTHTGEEQVQAVISITKEFPSTKDMGLPDLADVFLQDAETIEKVLHNSLPGGTYDRLAGLFLARKASHFVVRHDNKPE